MSQSDAEEAFLASAREAFRRDPGIGALDALGVWDLLGELGDREARAATFAVFRAHGRELGRSAALACLLAHPYAVGAGFAPGAIALAIPRASLRRGEVWVLLGEPSVEHVLLDQPGAGASIVALEDLELQPVAITGRLPVHEIAFDAQDAKAYLPEQRAVEGALDLALEHAAARVQFGKPIGSFQAVRHLLAWARTDCAAALEVSRQAAVLDLAAPQHFDEIAKALAGRNGRRICERSLQVLGGIGFTAEQDHHHFHSRVLALDSVLGTSAELTRGLGAWLRESRTDPRIPMQILHRGAGS
jgi:Acyl-CoA dehydrogenase, C-terminal domain